MLLSLGVYIRKKTLADTSPRLALAVLESFNGE